MTEKNSRKELHYSQTGGTVWKVTQQSGKAHPEDPDEFQSILNEGNLLSEPYNKVHKRRCFL